MHEYQAIETLCKQAKQATYHLAASTNDMRNQALLLIADEIVRNATSAVAADDLYWSAVAGSGQDIVLTGSAPDVPAKNAAMQRALAVAGVASVDNQIQIIGQAGSCQADLDSYSLKETIRFKTGKADVTEDSYNTISMLAMIIRTCPSRVEVAGHTDNKGGAEVNLKLSQRRADRVAKLLVNHGVLPDKIQATGYGET